MLSIIFFEARTFPMKQILSFQIFVFLFLMGCGSGSSNNSGTSTSSSGLPNDINGLIVFERTSSEAGSGPAVINPAGIFRLQLKKGQIIEKRTITSGVKSGYKGFAHPSGKIVFLEPCGTYGVNRFKIFKRNQLATLPLTPCSNTISVGVDYATPRHATGKLSPDGSKIATFIYYSKNNKYYYIVLIYDVNSGEEIKRFVNYSSPTWHPDGRLLMTSEGGEKFGLYLTNKDFTDLIRIDKNEINLAVGSSDISPTGGQVVFSMAQQIWIMDINGDNLRELIVGNSDLSFPTWSPFEKYIAYFRYGSRGDVDDKLMFYNLATNKKHELNTNSILPPSADGYNGAISPGGPLSWIR